MIIHNAKGVLHEASITDDGRIFLEQRREDIEAHNVPRVVSDSAYLTEAPDEASSSIVDRFRKRFSRHTSRSGSS